MELLRGDIAHAEKVISDAVKVNISQNEFDALWSFVFNVGAGNFLSSTLLKLLNNGDFHGASGQFRWRRFGLGFGGRPGQALDV